MSASITFLGAAQTVTGSKFLVEAGRARVLIDCGLFQGVKSLRRLNWDPFPIRASRINTVLLTHAHLDHTGYLPLLVKHGFSGKVWCTPPTKELTRIILMDSARIQQEDAQYANRRHFSRHDPARPLYTEREVKKALRLLEPVRDSDPVACGGKVQARFHMNSHILGSSWIELALEQFSIVFSGDLGRPHSLALPPTAEPHHGRFLILDSTYGDRNHDTEPPILFLERVVRETAERNGHLLIPSFAVGRTFEVLLLLAQLKKERRIPNLPIYLDSPMAVRALEVLREYSEWSSLPVEKIDAIVNLPAHVESIEESIDVSQRREPSIVIAGSGMLTGGRILVHLKSRLADPKNTVLLVGFQAAGTRGSLLLGSAPEIKIHGRYIPARARVEHLTTLSAHADQRETLEWLRSFRIPPERVFLVHGEPQALDALRVRIHDELGWECAIPSYLSKVSLSR